MTTATIFSGVSSNQNAGPNQYASNAVVNAGAPVDRASATLTVTPSTGFAEATILGGFDGQNWIGGAVAYVAPNSGGVVTASSRFPAHQYFTGLLTNIAPGCTATLTVTY
jgi:hypothetical protein